jgi:hypothetical protein
MDATSAASSSSSSAKWVMENGEQPHVLAVDDSLIDRKLIEKLLKNSSCKGNTLTIISWVLSVFSSFGSSLMH